MPFSLVHIATITATVVCCEEYIVQHSSSFLGGTLVCEDS